MPPPPLPQLLFSNALRNMQSSQEHFKQNFMEILWRRGESECIQSGQLENTIWEKKVQGNAGKVNRGLEAMSSSRLLCLKFLKITNSLVCYQWPKVSSPPHYPSTNLHHSLFVCLTLHKMDISVRRTPLESVLCPSYHLIESQMKGVKKGKNQLFRCWPFYRTVTVL